MSIKTDQTVHIVYADVTCCRFMSTTVSFIRQGTKYMLEGF